MEDLKVRQRLAAILAADVASYARLMAVDEQATIAALDSARAIFRSIIASHQGRVIDMAGDSVLAVFDTATGAVATALAVQDQLGVMAATVPEERRMRFRIGVHLGDIIEKSDGTVYGNGVNIAARLQALADAGGIAVSDMVRGAVRDRVSATFADQGEQVVKNIPHPVRAFRVEAADSSSRSRFREPEAVVGERGKPSIAVLQFNVLAEDNRVKFLADGLAEDVIALLARVPGFFVISRASSFLFPDRNPKIPQIARELGVRYIVAGSVRPIGDQLRISTQLTEAETGRLLWSGRFDSTPSAAVDLQDDIVRGVISELEPELTRAEIALVRRQRPENVDAWGCYRQAQGALALEGWSEDSLNEARSQLQRAFTIDPTFGLAWAHFALVTALGIQTGVIQSSPVMENDALEAAEKAIFLDEGSSQVLGYGGCALSDLGQHDRGLEILNRSLEIDPSNAQGHVALGAAHALSGDVDEAIKRMRYGMRISPRDRRLGFWSWALGVILLRSGRAEEALHEARTSAGRDPKLHLARVLEAAALQSLGRADEAHLALAVARRLRPVLALSEVARSHGRGIAKQIGELCHDNER